MANFISLRRAAAFLLAGLAAPLLSPSIDLCAQASPHTIAFAQSPGEIRTSKAFEAAKKQGAPELYAFLKQMPKGADLHMHISGAVYAETFIAEAAKLGLCIAPVDPGAPALPVAHGAVRFVQPFAYREAPVDPGPPMAGREPPCPTNAVHAADALRNQGLYDDLIDSLSMRAYVPTPGIDGHDQFFATFARFSGLEGMLGDWLDEVVRRAAAQNEQYLEIMNTPPSTHAIAAAAKIGWPVGIDDANYKGTFAKLREDLLANGLLDDVSVDRSEFQAGKNGRAALEHCDSSAQSALPSNAACDVTVHWLYQVLRGFPPQHVFAQMLLAFEVASVDPDVVGMNLVMPEDGRISMQDYHLQMLMLDYLHSVYPKVHISLHAGELAFGMVPPAGLSFHIREAVDLGHAERIGHGADVLYEIRPYDLMREMAQKHIMVEVNLTSNDVILGVKGKESPLAAYRAAHVPTALSTDDEGVSRIDLTHEYVKGALEQNLSYTDLKNMARTSLEHAFLPGESLWRNADDFTHRKDFCVAPIVSNSKPSTSCAAFLQANERAKLQWELERRFAAFEAGAHETSGLLD